MTDPSRAAAGVDAWLDTVRHRGAFTGPAIGFRAAGVLYTGPGWDWRLEGIFAARARRFAASRNPHHLSLLREEAASLRDAQFATGCFRCSWFDANPCEGGMPHEPAMLAALCRAASAVESAGSTIGVDVDAMTARYVEEFLLKRLWNRARRTFRDWEISEYQFHSASSVAAAIELLDAHGGRTARPDAFSLHIREAAASLVALQLPKGPAAGGIATSNRRGEGCSPYLTSRCIPALDTAARRTGDDRFRSAACRAAEFVARAQLADGGFCRLCSPAGAWTDGPLFLGATAGTLAALQRAGRIDAVDAARHTSFLLQHRLPTGAFRNAVGLGAALAPQGSPDWRDWLPSAGWMDKILDWLTAQPGAADLRPPAAIAPACLDASVLGRPARYEEDDSTIRITAAPGDSPLYLWRKRRPAPDICELPL